MRGCYDVGRKTAGSQRGCRDVYPAEICDKRLALGRQDVKAASDDFAFWDMAMQVGLGVLAPNSCARGRGMQRGQWKLLKLGPELQPDLLFWLFQRGLKVSLGTVGGRSSHGAC